MDVLDFFFFHVLPSIVILTVAFKKSLGTILKHVGYLQKHNFALNSLAYNVWVASC